MLLGASDREISEDERQPKHQVPPAAEDVWQTERGRGTSASLQADKPGRCLQHRTRGIPSYTLLYLYNISNPNVTLINTNVTLVIRHRCSSRTIYCEPATLTRIDVILFDGVVDI